MRMGVPASAVNCLEGCGLVFALGSKALGMGAMRVPRPAAGIITITFIAGCKYTSAEAGSSNGPLANGSSQHLSHRDAEGTENGIQETLYPKGERQSRGNSSLDL